MEGSSRKHARGQYYSTTFKTKEAKKLYTKKFKGRLVLAEWKVKCRDFVDDFAFISPLFEECGWKSVISLLVAPFEDMVKEFYANIEPIDMHSFRNFTRTKVIEVNRDLICSIIGVPLVNKSTYPYLPNTFPDKESMMMVFVDGTSLSWPTHQAKVKIVDFTEPMGTLSQIVSANIWSMGHYTEFGVD
jgi:hypothetical protein